MEIATEELQMTRYAKYKDSGVEWLGEIPEGWECIRMKHLFKDVSVKNRPESELLSVTQNQGVVPRTWVENRMVMPSGALESFKFIHKGDFAISLRSFEGGLEYCHHDGIISPAYTVLQAKRNFDSQFYKYLFKSFSFISELQTSVVGIREGKNISYPELSYSFLPVPTKETQTTVAEFLDRKTALIDQAIGIKEKQIDLLKERRQILIHQAVTRGLNPNVKMKDSGVEWIGEIPEGWEVKKAKFTFKKMEQGWSPQCDNYVAEIDEWGVLKVGCVNGFDFNPFENKVLPMPLKPKLEYQIKKRDILISRANTLELVGSAAFVGDISHKLLLCDKLYRVHILEDKIDTEFYIFLLKTSYARAHIEINASGASSTMQNIGQGCIKNMLLFLPEIEEQRQIVSYLKHALEKISVSISLKEKETEKLKEYKASLINSAVTGKIKVR